MFREMCKSKIKGLKITGLKRECSGSIGIDGEILKKADILKGEMVYVLNMQTGARFETYAIYEKKGSLDCILYGPAARLGEVGDEVVILSSCLIPDKEARQFKLKVIEV
ncbi:MAG: aspartate 1-decarboxylase [bacterium]